MLTSVRPPFASGVVARLRIALAVVLSVLLCVAVTSYVQIRNFNTATEELTRNALQAFIRTEESQRSLTNLILLLQRADTVAQPEELSEVEDAVSAQLSDLHAELRGLQQIDFALDSASQYNSALEELEANAQQVFDLRHSILSQRQSLDDLQQRLQRIRGETQTLLEGLSFHTAQEAPAFLGSRRAPSARDFDEFVQAYSQSLSVANVISSLLLEVEATVDTALSVRYILRQEELLAAENALRLRARQSVVLLSQLPASDARSELAHAFVDIRQTLFDEGILQVVGDIQSKTALLDAVQWAQLDTIRGISLISQELVDVSRREIEMARASLSQASRLLVLIWTSAGIVATLVVGVALVFIVERQINRRVSKLTTAVLEIAAGDTSYHVGVEGEDEFGKIARALEIFKANAQELSRSNEDLEKFAYVAAHDLRSPLRAIQDLAEWTLEDPDSSFSEDAREHMGLLQNRIVRLNRLLTDLMEYSQVGEEGGDIRDVSLSDVVAEIADMLDSDGKFDVVLTGTMDQVSTCATPLRQILLNLASNAIKHHDKATGKISIDVKDMDDRLVFSVADDGPGIPGRYHQRIFELFQTLRPRDDVEGSGLGLAIVRKLIERHGGGLSVVSDPEIRRGTTFVFDLPSMPQKQPATQRAA